MLSHTEYNGAGPPASLPQPQLFYIYHRVITLFAQERGHFLCPSPRTVSLVAAAALLPASGSGDKRGARIGFHNFKIDTVILTQYS